MNKIKARKGVIYIDKEWHLGITMCILLISIFVRNSTYEMTILSPNVKDYISFFVKGLVLLSFFISLTSIINRLTKKFVFMLISLIFFVIVHILLFPDNNVYFIDTAIGFAFTILPGMLCAYSIRDTHLFYEKLITTSEIISIANIFCLLIYLFFGIGNSESMGLSNALIIPINALLSKLVRKERKIKYFIFLIFDILTIVLYGSRGALVSVIVFLFIMFLRNESQNKNKHFIRIITILLIITILFFIADALLNIIKGFLESFGVSSRAIDLLISGKFLGDNGRFLIWDTLIDEIIKHPLLIRGINSERLLRTGFYKTSNYAHNLVLEIVYSFGVPIGIIITLIFTKLILKTCYRIQNDTEVIRLIYLCGFFPICLFSGSVWESISWWIWVAFCNKKLDCAIEKIEREL